MKTRKKNDLQQSHFSEKWKKECGGIVKENLAE